MALFIRQQYGPFHAPQCAQNLPVATVATMTSINPASLFVQSLILDGFCVWTGPEERPLPTAVTDFQTPRAQAGIPNHSHSVLQ